MKAYKGFDKELRCRDFQYEIGKEYHEKTADLCRAGFHACENPLDTLRYYAPGSSRYCEVELDEVSDQRDIDTKRAAKKIKIGAEIGLKGVIDAGVKFIFEKCEDATEERASGVRGNAAASGWSGNAAASGESGNAAASGWRGNAAASGDRGSAAASGERGCAVSSGKYGSAEANGKQCIAVAFGEQGRARGKIGNWIVVAEYGSDGKIIEPKIAVVDGENIKQDTWYTVKNGEFVEVED